MTLLLARNTLPFEIFAEIIAIVVELKKPNYGDKTDLWYLLSIYDNKFYDYSRSTNGMRKYVEKAVVIENYYTSKNHGSTFTYLFGSRQSIYDEPAHKWVDGNKFISIWFHKDWTHRIYNPAYIYHDDEKYNYKYYNYGILIKDVKSASYYA
jgi:hypothetical protein